MSWINLGAVWKIIVFGLLAGAGLPAVYAIGMVALAWSRPPAGGGAAGTRNMTRLAAGVCFLLVLTAIGWGIYEIYRLGHPAK